MTTHETDPRHAAAIAAFDAANAGDPRTDIVDGVPVPRELLYAQRMSRRLVRFEPNASEALVLAVRCQHIRRWEHPRDAYPEGRAGYKRWRTELALFHARVAADILRQVGYDETLVERVADLVLKKRLRTDPEVQTLEDVVCLVFLEHYFAEFAQKHAPEKIVDIVRKTWAKMSPRAHAEALTLPLDDASLALVRAALSP